MRLDDLLARLEGVTGGDGQFYARCPAHDDRQASLSVAQGRDGRLLLTCWAGCAVEEITRALGIELADLFDHEQKQREQLGIGAALASALKPVLPDELAIAQDVLHLQRSRPTMQAIYDLKGWRAGTLVALDVGLRHNRLTIPVRDPQGKVVNWLRYWPKATPKMLATRGYPRTPYYALIDDGLIWVVEGETDAITMANAGFNVIGAPGATAKAHAEWLEVVRDRDVIACFDYDEPGNKAALKWARAATDRRAASVRILSFVGKPKAYDVTDLLLDLDRDADQFRARMIELAEGAEPYEEAMRPKHMPTPAPSHEDVEPGEIITRKLSSYGVERLPMLWRDRIPQGRVGVIYGPPGQGKSTLLALMVADVTRAGGRVLIASGDENDPATTLLPRMIAAGADVGLVELMWTKAAQGETELVLPRDLDALGRRMAGFAMLLIDPLSAHLGDDINAWKEQQVRSQVLAPLAYHARASRCAVPYIAHMNKSNGTDALSRLSGTGGFGAAARFALLLGSHPDDVGLEPDDRRLVLVHVKANESARMPALVFRRRIVGVDGVEEVAAVPILEVIDDRASIAPEAVLAISDPDEAGAYSEAIEFLRRELSDGPKLAKRLLAMTRERGDFSERTLRKAKRALNIKSDREAEGWWWRHAFKDEA